MANGSKLDFLMGATSPGGFKGYFELLQKPQDGGRLLLIKAGPGCGKSTLMNKIADALSQQGETVELIHCSSDPGSLDGVICTNKKFAIIDATAPHTVEPKWPGAYEEVVSLYDFSDRKKLAAHRDRICELFDACAQLHERAGRYITAAGSLNYDTFRLAAFHTDFEKARAYGRHLAAKHLPPKEGKGREAVRMLTAMTLDGPLAYRETVSAAAEQIVILEDEYGPAAKEVLKTLREEALSRGYSVITCYCAMYPHDKIDHLIIPEASFAAVTSNHYHPFVYEGVRRVHCDRFCDKKALALRRKRMRFNLRAATELIDQASVMQQEAKKHHDELEHYYKNALDLQKLDQVAEEIIATL